MFNQRQLSLVANAVIDKLCNFSDYLDMDIPEYIKFVNDGIGYQRELALIKHLTLE